MVATCSAKKPHIAASLQATVIGPSSGQWEGTRNLLGKVLLLYVGTSLSSLIFAAPSSYLEWWLEGVSLIPWRDTFQKWSSREPKGARTWMTPRSWQPPELPTSRLLRWKVSLFGQTPQLVLFTCSPVQSLTKNEDVPWEVMFALIPWEEAGTKCQLNGAFTLCQVSRFAGLHSVWICNPWAPDLSLLLMPGIYQVKRKTMMRLLGRSKLCFVPRGIISWINWQWWAPIQQAEDEFRL